MISRFFGRSGVRLVAPGISVTGDDDGRLSDLTTKLYGDIDTLRARGLSDATDRQLRILLRHLDDAVALISRSDHGAAGSVVAMVAAQVANVQNAVPGPGEPDRMATAQFEAAAGIYLRLIDLHMMDQRTQHAVVTLILQRIEDFRQASGASVRTQISGTSMCVLFADEGAAVPRTEHAFMLGLYLQDALSEAHYPAVVVVIRADDFESFEGAGLDRPAMLGAPFVDAAAIASPASDSALVLTAATFAALRSSLPALRTGHNNDAAPLITYCRDNLVGIRQPMSLGADGRRLVFDFVEFRPLNYKSDPRPYSLSVRDGQTAMTVLGSAPSVRQRLQFAYRDADEELDRELYDAMVDADTVEIIGVTHGRMAELIDKAWLVRKQRGLRPWQTLRIYFPSAEVLHTTASDPDDRPERSQQWRAGIKSVTQLLEARPGMAADQRVVEYQISLPFLGARVVLRGDVRFRLALPIPAISSTDRPYFEVDLSSRFGRQVESVFKTLRESSRDLFDRTVWGSVVRTDAHEEMNHAGVFSVDPREEDLFRASALIILHAETAGRQRLLLQLRNQFNADDSLDTFSNISVRLFEADLLAASTDAAALIPAPRSDSDEVATTRVYHALSLADDSFIPRAAFTNAAQRECLAHLGLDIDPERLVWHTTSALSSGPKRLFFDIYSLQLVRGEIDEKTLIEQRRPYAGLEFFRIKDIEVLRRDGQLNSLFELRLNDVFLPIFKTLRLA
jgi:hypothetical protein